ncbi:MAG: sodium:glutamate symporter, partial [Tissierellia bacterium]|nr:sodium:glutamate symporter [Tissierellia bacterium]
FVVRNFNEKFNWFNVNQTLLDSMSDISLGIFLSMAMISLKLWELFELAIPLLIILSVLLAFTLIFVYFVVFTILGKDFDSAVMCAGLIGHGLGATPNAIANMESVSEKYGVSRVAFLIVPIVGGFLQDLFLVPVNVFLINLFG